MKKLIGVFVILLLLGSCVVDPDDKDTVNLINVPDELTYVTEKNYADVVDLLENAGFKNIDLEEIVTEESINEGNVCEILIDGSKDFTDDDEFEENVEIIIKYYIKDDAEINDDLVDEGNVIDDVMSNDSTLIDDQIIDEEAMDDANNESSDDVHTDIEKVEIPYQNVESCNIYYKTEYSHIDMEIIRLGDKETATIELEAEPAGLTLDDFIIVYDESLIKASFEDVVSNEASNETLITMHISAISEGVSEIIIIPAYDYVTKAEEDIRGYVLTVKGYGSKEGKIVYITSSGEKYHYSKKCAGDSAYGTTLAEAKAYEYSPCGNCVD